MQFIKVGNKIINLNAIAYVDLMSKPKIYVYLMPIESESSDRQAYPVGLCFSGEESAALLWYFSKKQQRESMVDVLDEYRDYTSVDNDPHYNSNDQVSDYEIDPSSDDDSLTYF